MSGEQTSTRQTSGQLFGPCSTMAARATTKPAVWIRTPWPGVAALSATIIPTPCDLLISLAWDLYHLGDPQAARGLNQDTLARRRRILGDDHHDTLCSANSLAVDLIAVSDLHAARMLTQDTLTRRRRVLADDHPDTLISRRGPGHPRRPPGSTGNTCTFST
jgi:Tetratricopeptide repeat